MQSTQGTITDMTQMAAYTKNSMRIHTRLQKNIYALPGLDKTGERDVVGKPEDENGTLRYKKLLRQINEHFNIKGFDLYNKRGKMAISFPRQIAMYLLYNHYKYSSPQIADILGKDHTTVLSGKKAIADYLSLPVSKEKDAIVEFITKYNYESCLSKPPLVAPV